MTAPLITGTFVGESGAAASGQAVTAWAWPTGEYIDAQSEHGYVTPKLLDTTTTLSHGSYSLSPTLSGLGTTYTEPDGSVSLEVVASDTSGDIQSYNVSAAAPGTLAATSPYIVSSGVQSTTLRFNLSNDTVAHALGTDLPVQTSSPTTAKASTASDTIADTPLATANASPASSPDSGGPPGIPYASCSTTWVKAKYYPRRQEKFMNLYNYGSASVDEEVGSSHTLGVGVAVTGGSWSAGGDASIENHSSAGGDRPYSGTNYQLSNYVNYEHLTNKCHTGNKIYYRHEVRPTSMNALLVSAVHIINRSWNINNCVLYTSGNFRKTKGKNQSFSTGVSAPFISLSASASYSADTTVTWSPTRSQPEEICGSSSAGWVTASFAGGEAQPRTGCGGAATQPVTLSGSDARYAPLNTTSVIPAC